MAQLKYWNGSAWVTAIVGAAGANGTNGVDGLVGGIRYTFSTSTTDSDPGAGNFRFNSGTIGSVTFIYIDNQSIGATDQMTWYDSWDDDARGQIVINTSNVTTGLSAIFSVSGAVTVASGYYKIPVTYVSGALPVNGTTYSFNFIKTGITTAVPLANITGLGTNVSTFLATPSSTNLLNAVTDESGTGTLVFSTSPVLTTPNIGAAVATSVNVAGNVSAQSFNVPSPRTNLVANPNFETNITGWSFGEDALVERVSTTPKNGSWCLRVQPNFVGEFVAYPVSNVLTVGVAYTASAWVRSESGSRTIELIFSAGSTSVTESITATTSWQQITVSNVTATVGGNLQVLIKAPSGGNHFVDSVIVETTSSYEGFFDGNTPGAAWTGTANASTSTTTGTGTVGVANLSGATFAGNVTAPNFNGKVALANVTGLGFNVSTFLASPSSTNLLNAVQDESGTGTLVFSTSPVLTTPNIGAAVATSVNVAGNVSATSISAQSFNIAAFSRTNLVVNPNFEQNMNNWSSNNYTQRLQQSGMLYAKNGGYFLYATPDDETITTAYYTKTNSLTIGTSYRAGAWVNIQGGGGAENVTITLGSASQVYSVPNNNTTWTFISTPAWTANTTTASLTIRFGSYGNLCNIDSVIIEATSTWTGEFFDGNTLDTGTTDYAWTGTANASTSTAIGSAVGLANLSGGAFTGNISGTNIFLSGNINSTTVNATTLIGNTNASTITTGTIDNARTSANSANGASTIVARDIAGSFYANDIYATRFNGSGANLTSIPNSSLVNNSITINGNAVALGGNITIAGSSGNSFETISANGTSVVADSSTDTLTITPGSGMSIVGNATSDTVTFSVDYAEKIYYLVRNNTGSTIPKGTLVSASGAEASGRIDVAPYSTTGTQDSELRVMGMATANISNGVNGEVISFGTLVGIDTRGDTASAIAVGDETWAEGDILYAHPTVAGKLTKVRPQHDLAVAFITVRHASTGQIAVRIIPGNHHLEWLHDVAIDGTPADNELLAYNSASSLWINQTAEEAGVASLSGATFTGNVAGTNISVTGNVNATTVNATTFTGTAAFANTAFSVAISNVSSMGTNVSTFLTTPNSINFLNTITDETGTGNVVFSTSPVLTTPNIGAAIGTSVNVTGQLISTVATGTAPLSVTSTTMVQNLTAQVATQINTIANTTSATFYPTFVDANNETTAVENVYTGAGLTFNPSSGNLTTNGLTSTAAVSLNYASPTISSNNASAASIFTSTVTGVTIGSSTIRTTAFPADATTTTATAGAGFMGLPQNATTTGSATIDATDAGKHIYASATRTVTIPANETTAFPIGTTLTFIAGIGATMTIAITTDTMYLAGPGTTGSRTLAPFGMATAVKITSTTWIISGNGLT
jgi:hypothetical protein